MGEKLSEESTNLPDQGREKFFPPAVLGVLSRQKIVVDVWLAHTVLASTGRQNICEETVTCLKIKKILNDGVCM